MNIETSVNIEKVIVNRRSYPKLVSPAPDAAVVARMITAAIHAPDHGRVQPWRFIVIEGDGLDALGELFVEAETIKGQANPSRLNTLRQQPHRAPMIVTVVANIEKDHAIPPVERQVAVGCAVQNLILLAEAAGFGTYWRTGPMAYDAVVKRGLGLSESEEIIAFVYVGTAAGEVPKRSIQSVTQVTQRWSGGKPQAWV